MRLTHWRCIMGGWCASTRVILKLAVAAARDLGSPRAAQRAPRAQQRPRQGSVCPSDWVWPRSTALISRFRQGGGSTKFQFKKFKFKFNTLIELNQLPAFDLQHPHEEVHSRSVRAAQLSVGGGRVKCSCSWPQARQTALSKQLPQRRPTGRSKKRRNKKDKGGQISWDPTACHGENRGFHL